MPPKQDDRFARLQTDPRFRRPKQKSLKVEIDDRFKDVLQSEEFGRGGTSRTKVDKRGRKLGSSHQQDQLKHFYRLKSPTLDEAEAEEGGEGGKGFVDYARGEGNLESSGSEDEESEVEEEELELGQRQAPSIRRHLRASSDESDSESEGEPDSGSEGSHLDIDLSENEASAFPPEDDDGDEEEEEEENYAEPSKRIAAVNLDWDNLRAADLYSVFNSFLKPSGKNGESSTSAGRLVSVKIFPSEFGKERLAKEEQEGPGGGVFISKKGNVGVKGKGKEKRRERASRRVGEDSEEEAYDTADEDQAELDSLDEDELDDLDGDLSEGDEEEDDDSESEEEDEDDGLDDELEEGEELEMVSDIDSDAGSEDINMDQLRQYQLERLRYYYAIAEFSTVQASMKVLSECNGTEFERTANMFDLTYVPEEMDFDEADLVDQATKEPKAYKGNDFVTDALRHSKVKLTWDQDDPNRSKLTRRTLTKDEIEEEDFKAYLASSGSESEPEDDEAGVKSSSKDVKAKKSKKSAKAEKDRLRALLLNGNDEDGDVWGKAGLSNGASLKADKEDTGMEITFRPGLSAGGSTSVNEENLTTLEKYQLRMKEKKARKKEKAELKRSTKDDSPEAKDDPKSRAKDDFFGDSDDDDSVHDDQPLELPEDEIVPEEADEDLHEDLGGGGKMGVDHFSMKDILKSEKESGKKKRSRTKKKKGGKEGMEREVELGKEGWKIDTKDPRFKVLHTEGDFAIDPSNPHFTKTKAMTELLAERSKRRAEVADRAPVERKQAKVLREEVDVDKDLGSLVQSLKRKMGEGNKRVRKRPKK